MIRLRNIFLIFSFAGFILCAFQGCSWFHSAKPSSSQEKSPPILDSAKLIDAEPLKKGGKIQIIPFTAGIDVEASQELDRMALGIIQGATEIINAENEKENLTVVFGEEADKSDFRMSGHITRFKKNSRLKKFFFKKTIDVTIEGKMVSQRTGETLFIFTHRKKIQGKEPSLKNLGRIMGHDLGRYISSIL